jgi:hypothetical protein
VIETYDNEKIITVMFGGAWSGLYSVDIRHSSFGLIDTSKLAFTVGTNVTSVMP